MIVISIGIIKLLILWLQKISFEKYCQEVIEKVLV